MRRRAAATAALLALVALGAPALGAPAAASGAVNPLLGRARLYGRFQLAGRITKATGVPGEHKGQTVSRIWTLIPACAKGSCRRVKLTRARETGTDRLVLTRKKPGTYQGSGSFYAPLRCAGRTYPRGELVPFTVSVTVSAAIVTRIGVLATRVTATYASRTRVNRTSCVGGLGSDAASYHGHIVPPTSSGGAPATAGASGGS